MIVFERSQAQAEVHEGAPAPQIASRRLANGVWLLTETTAQPAPGYRGVAAIQLWIAAGAAGERPSEHGCAHLFEHMVFKPFVDADGRTRDLAGVVEQLGGDVNAFTSHDETVFHATVPADAFAEAADVLLQAVFGRSFAADLLAREQDVVVEEIRQYADDPSARSVQYMMGDLYGAHAYARPVLGEEHEVRALTPAALRGWARRQHRGAGVLLVVVGPIAMAEVEALAERSLAALEPSPQSAGSTGPAGSAGPSSARASKKSKPRPPSDVQVRVAREDVQEAYVRFGWLGGRGLDLDALALDVAAVALGQGESSRLARSVRRRAQLVSDVHAAYMGGLASGTFMVSAQADPDTAAQACQALLDQVAALAERPLADDEFARARALLQSSLIYRRETVQGQAHALGYFASSTGELGAEDRYFDMLDALTPTHVREACARYLSREQAALTVLLPRDRVDARAARGLASKLRAAIAGRGRSKRGAPVQAHVDRVHVDLAHVDLRGVEPNKDKSKRRRGSGFGRPRVDGSGIWKARHRCGLRVVARPDTSVPMTAGWLVWPGGLRVEPLRAAGTSSLLAALLTRGSARRTGDQLADEIEGWAAVLDGFAGHDSVGLQSECLAEHLPLLLARTFECALEPSFAADEIDEARRIVLADLEADADDPGHVAYRTMLGTLYGRHPYGRDLRGTAASLERIDHRKLAQGWAQAYPIGGAVLSLAGDFEIDALLDAVGEALRDVPATERTLPPTRGPARGKAPSWPKRARIHTITRAREQGQCVMGFPGLAIGDPECAALDVLCTVLGGQAGRLFEALREREGLVYQVGANSSEHLDAGHVVFYAAASQDKLDAAREAILAEIARVCEAGVEVDELERAKRWLIGQFESSLQRRSRVASRLVFGEAYGLGSGWFLRYPERVAAVDRAQVLALARRVLDPRRRVVVLVRA